MHFLIGLVVIGLIIWAFDINFKNFVRVTAYLALIGVVALIGYVIYLEDHKSKANVASDNEDSRMVELHREFEKHLSYDPSTPAGRWNLFVHTVDEKTMAACIKKAERGDTISISSLEACVGYKPKS